MSAYSETVTTFTDAELLCEALREMGFSEVLHHQTAQRLEGYHGDKRKETAEVIVPRRVVGSASNDIGFKRNAAGVFQAIISDFDSGKHDAAWLKRLRQTYDEKGIERNATRAGLRFAGRKVLPNGKVQYQYVKA